jgi:hypothetical protein
MAGQKDDLRDPLASVSFFVTECLPLHLYNIESISISAIAQGYLLSNTVCSYG